MKLRTTLGAVLQRESFKKEFEGKAKDHLQICFPLTKMENTHFLNIIDKTLKSWKDNSQTVSGQNHKHTNRKPEAQQ